MHQFSDGPSSERCWSLRVGWSTPIHISEVRYVCVFHVWMLKWAGGITHAKLVEKHSRDSIVRMARGKGIECRLDSKAKMMMV